MNKLNEIISRCKGSVTLQCNDHRSYYETIPQSIDDRFLKYIPEDVLAEMVARDTCLEIQFYPNTPIGFIRLYHYDLDALLHLALGSLNENLV